MGPLFVGIVSTRTIVQEQLMLVIVLPTVSAIWFFPLFQIKNFILQILPTVISVFVCKGLLALYCKRRKDPLRLCAQTSA